MNPLQDILVRRISQSGPITIADFMADCLLHPEHGYYTTRDPLGVDGDFTTAPEISQMFGEMIGLCIAQAWLDQGCPTQFTLAELGPGRGTLMADLLRATRSIKGFHAALRIVLVERSVPLKNLQRQSIQNHEISWIEDISDLPDAPTFLIANEFFDALPIRQFARADDGWCERQIGYNDGQLCFGLSPSARLGELSHRLGDTAAGDVVETCAAAGPIIREIATRIAKHGGVAIIIDYGDWQSKGDTLQAVQNHHAIDPLASPGMVDLTAHVDFQAISDAAKTVSTTHMITQGVFLEQLGITARAQTLAQKLTVGELDSHIAAHRRLTHPDEMGNLFKAMALYPSDGQPPSGF